MNRRTHLNHIALLFLVALFFAGHRATAATQAITADPSTGILNAGGTLQHGFTVPAGQTITLLSGATLNAASGSVVLPTTPSTMATTITVGSITALRGFNVTSFPNGGYARTAGYYLANDGGGGVYVWNSTSTATDNGGTIIQPTGLTTGRWILQTNGVLDVRQFGAKGDGSTDDQSSIAATVSAASSAGYSVHIPAGIFMHSGQLSMSSCKMFGDGPASELRASSAGTAALTVSGDRSSVRNVSFSCVSASRQPSSSSDSIVVSGATNFAIVGCWFKASARMAVYVVNSSYGQISANNVTATNADGIHLDGGCDTVTIYGNTESNTGDDSIATVGIGSLNTNVTIASNTLSGGSARAISVYGSQFVTIEGNTVYNYSKSAGIAMGYDSTFGTLGTSFVTIVGNTFDTCGSFSPIHNAVFQLNSSNTYTCQNITLAGNHVYNSAAWFLQCTGSGFKNFKIVNNVFDTNANNSGFEFVGLNDLDFVGNKLRNVWAYAITGDSTCGGYWRVSRNVFEDINKSNTATNDCVNVDNAPFTEFEMYENILTQPGGTTIERYLEAIGATNTAFYQNTGISATTLGTANDNLIYVSNGSVAFGSPLNANATSPNKFATTIQVTGFTNPTSGKGLELGNDGTEGLVQAYNRGVGAMPLWLNVGYGSVGAVNTGMLQVKDTTDAATGSGSLTTAGGAYVAKKLIVGSSVIAADAAAIIHTSSTYNNGAGAATATLTNAPAAGNPTKWIPIDDNGTTRYIPAW